MTTSRDANDDVEAVFVLSTRPEIIKTAPVIRAARSADGIQPYIVHTNQHYDPELSEAFFDVLELPPPDANLEVGSGSQAEQTAAGLTAIERVVEERDPAIVLAQGDTNAVLSAALATSKLSSVFGHIEAGLRSFDRCPKR
jgi:UDP-N-acetylglucosamine 2-epimerase (non-hydrolysing)